MLQKLRSSLWPGLCLAVLISACKKDNAEETVQLYPVKENARWGYMDASGKTVVAPAYDYTWDFVEGMGRFKDKGKYGFINDKGEVVIPATYAFAADFANGYARINIKDTTIADVQYDGYNLNYLWTYTNAQGIVFSQTFSHIEDFKNGVAAVKEEVGAEVPTRYATVDNGQLVVQDRVTKGVFDFNGHLLAPASDEASGKLGMIDETENWVVQPSFDNLEPYHEGLAVARKNNQYGYIDLKGNWVYSRVVPVNQYIYITNDFKPFTNGLAVAKTGTDTYQYIDQKGQVAFKTRFKNAGNFTKDGYAIVTVDAGTGLIDKQGNWAIKPNVNIQSVANGIAIYYNEQGYSGARDIKTQKDIIPPTYSAIEQTGNLLRVRNAGATYGYVNDRGDFIIQPQYDNAWPFDNGKAIVNTKDKYFYVDATGRNLGPVPDDKNPYGSQSYLYAWTEDNGKFGFWKNGKSVLPANYDYATSFEGNVARINMGAKSNEESYGYSGGQWGLIDAKGKAILAPKYTLIMPFNNGVALVNNGGTAQYFPCEEECEQEVFYTCVGGTWGLLKNDGTEVIKPGYDYLVPFGKNFLAATGGKWSVLDATGNTVYAGPIEIDINPGAAEEDFDPDAPKAYAETEYNKDQIHDYHDYNFIEARESGRTGIISTDGKWLLKPEFDNVIYHNATAATPFTEGKVSVKVNGSWGAADASGNLVIPATYTGIRNFSNGFAAVRIGELWGFIDESNTIVVPATYANVRDVQGHVAIVQKEQNNGESVIDLNNGKEIIAATPGAFPAPDGFVHGLCVFTEEGEGETLKTVFSETGKDVFNRTYDDVQIYADLVYVQDDNKWAMATHDGRLLTGFDYSWIEPYYGQTWIRCSTGGEVYWEDMGDGPSVYGGLWGILDKSGKLHAPPALAEIGKFNNSNLAPARANKDLDEIGYFDRSGKPVSALKK